MSICHCAIVRKCVRIRIGLKLILGLAIIAAGTLASCCVDALWLNVITLVAVGGVGVWGWIFELLSSIYNAVIGKGSRCRGRINIA